MKDWVECESCWAEFRVVSDSDEIVSFCPFCGTEIDCSEDDEDEDYEDEY